MELCLAATSGDIARLKTLIAEGADVNTAFRGMTPLVCATSETDEKGAPIMRALLEAGANVNVTDPRWPRRTLLHLMMNRQSPRMAIELIKGKANVNEVSEVGQWPRSLLFYAWGDRGRRVMIAILLASGINNIDQEVFLPPSPGGGYEVRKTTFRKEFLKDRSEEELKFLLQFAKENLFNITPEQFTEMLARLRGYKEYDDATYDVIEEYLKETKREAERWKLRRPAVAMWQARTGYNIRGANLLLANMLANTRPSAGAATGPSVASGSPVAGAATGPSVASGSPVAGAATGPSVVISNTKSKGCKGGSCVISGGRRSTLKNKKKRRGTRK